MRFAIIAGVFALAAVSAAQAEPTQPTTADTAAVPAQKTKKICRKEDKTGSVVPKRVCRTVVIDQKPKPVSSEPVNSAS